MTRSERNQVVAETLLEVASALADGAAGPTHYWFNELAKRLTKRAENRIHKDYEEVKRRG